MKIDSITTAKLALSIDEKEILEKASDILCELHHEMTKEELTIIQNCEEKWFTTDNLRYVFTLLDFLTESTNLELCKG